MLPELRISDRAQADLDHIYDYGVDTWGAMQADSYASDIVHLLGLLRGQPRLGRARPDLPGRNLRSLPVGRHLVIYRIEERHLRIIRVLHSAVDVVRKLTDEPQD